MYILNRNDITTLASYDRLRVIRSYLHNVTAEKWGWGYTHNRNVTDDLCSFIKLCFAFITVNFST